MKILMTMVAALAITSAASAQQTECTFTTDGESVVRTFDGLARIVNLPGQDAVNVVNRRTGEVLDTVEFGGDRFGVRCGRAGSAQNTAPVATPDVSNDAPQTTNSTRRFTRITRSTSSPAPTATSTPSSPSTSTRRGFSPSAALGLPN